MRQQVSSIPSVASRNTPKDRIDKQARPSGIDVIGAIPWGTHFCQFYNPQADLSENLVPYFEAGLGAGEACLWVTGAKLEAQQAEALMIDAVPEFNKFISSGQMEIVAIADWYAPAMPSIRTPCCRGGSTRKPAPGSAALQACV